MSCHSLDDSVHVVIGAHHVIVRVDNTRDVLTLLDKFEVVVFAVSFNSIIPNAPVPLPLNPLAEYKRNRLWSTYFFVIDSL